jgi:hypothetical protein
MEQLFILGIGGTGMRCLEAFVHLCAMGMLDNKEIHILALDTDLDNGNYDRLKSLITEGYLKVKGVNNKKHFALKDTFFSANIKLYKFSPDYSKEDTGRFDRLVSLIDEPKEVRDFANLMFTESVQNFDLKHGYRTQTHIGSLLMYHALRKEAENINSDISRFLKILVDATSIGNPRVFVMGSVFGGTGASSIPIVPKALNDIASRTMEGKNLSNAFFGSILLTNYFTFDSASKSDKEIQKVIADAKNFAINSQAALMYYEDDSTVKTTYKHFYILGTDDNNFRPIEKQDKNITGGFSQRNDSHYIELVAASAAYDFFTAKDVKLDDNGVTRYFFRSVDKDGVLDFKDFIDTSEEEFRKKWTLFTALSFLVNLENTDVVTALKQGKWQNDKKQVISDYLNIENEEIRGLKHYFNLYHFDVNSPNHFDGWLRQLHRSAKGKENLLFNARMFSRDVQNFTYQSIFSRNEYEKYNFKAGSTLGIKREGNAADAFDYFKKQFLLTHEDSSITNTCERLIKRIYDTLVQIYKF